MLLLFGFSQAHCMSEDNSFYLAPTLHTYTDRLQSGLQMCSKYKQTKALRSASLLGLWLSFTCPKYVFSKKENE